MEGWSNQRDSGFYWLLIPKGRYDCAEMEGGWPGWRGSKDVLLRSHYAAPTDIRKILPLLITLLSGRLCVSNLDILCCSTLTTMLKKIRKVYVFCLLPVLSLAHTCT